MGRYVKCGRCGKEGNENTMTVRTDDTGNLLLLCDNCEAYEKIKEATP